VGEVADTLAAGIPKIAVTDAGTWVLSYSPEDAKRANAELERNYRVIFERDAIRVWLRKSDEPHGKAKRASARPATSNSTRVASR
jgi:hypothetical protein